MPSMEISSRCETSSRPSCADTTPTNMRSRTCGRAGKFLRFGTFAAFSRLRSHRGRRRPLAKGRGRRDFARGARQTSDVEGVCASLSPSEVTSPRIRTRLRPHFNELGIRMGHDGGEHDAAQDDRPRRIPIDPEHRSRSSVLWVINRERSTAVPGSGKIRSPQDRVVYPGDARLPAWLTSRQAGSGKLADALL